MTNLGIIKSFVANTFESIKNSITSSLETAVNVGIGFINQLITALNAIPLVNIPAIPTLGGGSSGGTGTVPRTASGGYRSGMTWAGENGPELIDVPSGTYIHNNPSSQRMSNQPVRAYIDYDELARTLGRVLGQQMQRA